MKRDLYEKLIEWKKDNNRKPIIIKKGSGRLEKPF
jgi:hypothetical protein